jgi:acetyl esterase
VSQLDPELAAVVPSLDYYDLSDIEVGRRLDIELTAQATEFPDLPSDRVDVVERTLPGPPGAREIPARIYTPRDATGPLGAVLLIHGGAFCCGDIESDHARSIYYAGDCDCLVLNIEYRLAPENPYPAAVEDCYAALEWIAVNHAVLGVDPARVAVAGESAGGALAAATALLAHDRGGPQVALQMLLFPVLDHRLKTRSMCEFTDTPVWHAEGNRLMWDYYVGHLRPDRVPAYASPALRGDLAGVAPAYIATAEFGPVRDEGLEYAVRLLDAGVSAEIHNYPGAFHVFDMVVPTANISQRAIGEQTAVLRRVLRP